MSLTTAMMPFMDDILDEGDVLMIFDEVEVRNWSLQISFSWRRLFLNLFVDERPKMSFPPAFDVRDNITHAE